MSLWVVSKLVKANIAVFAAIWLAIFCAAPLAAESKKQAPPSDHGSINSISPKPSESASPDNYSAEQASSDNPSEKISAAQKLHQEAKSLILSNPAESLVQANKAANLLENLENGTSELLELKTQSWWLVAEANNRLSHIEDAQTALDKAFGYAGTLPQNTKLQADLQMTQGHNYRSLVKMEKALDAYYAAHKIYQQIDNSRGQAIALQSIGAVYNYARHYEKVIDYYSQAAQAYSGEPELDLSYYNNLATAYKETGAFDQALDYFQKAYAIGDKLDSNVLRARILTNIADLHVAIQDYEAALENADRAMQFLQEDTNNDWRRFLYGIKAKAAYGQERYEDAAKFLDMTFADLKIDDEQVKFMDFHQYGYRIYAKLGAYKKALQFLETYKRLDDRSREVVQSANLALIGAEFDFENQNLRIEKLEQKKTLNQLEVEKAQAAQFLVVALSIATFITLLAMVAIWRAYTLAKSRKALNTAYEQLEDANSQLSEVNTELRRANAAKSEFLATTNHELRTPLNGVLGMAQILQRSTGLNERDRMHVSMLETLAQDLLTLVNDILDLSKIESGKFDIYEKPFELERLGDGFLGIWMAQRDSRDIDFSVYVDPELPDWVMADGRRLRQILLNFISNALKFTNSGKVAVRILKDHQQLEDGKISLRLEVEDSGIGIATEDHKRIFGAFEQIETGTQRRYAGTGLGLAICKRLANLMKAEIGMHSQIGKGSLFWASVPLQMMKAPTLAAQDRANIQDAGDVMMRLKQAYSVGDQGQIANSEQDPAQKNSDSKGVIASDKPAEPSLQPIGKKRETPKSLAFCDVLVVEDNLINQMVIKEMLTPFLRRVDCVDNGSLAIEALATSHYDVVIMDKRMPVMDGVQATMEIRKLQYPICDIPIIALTADSIEGEKERLLQVGMDGFLAKPSRPNEIIKQIEDIVLYGQNQRRDKAKTQSATNGAASDSA